MKNISMIGVDLAKNVFQVHGVDAAGKVLVQRQLRRRQMEKFLAALPVGVVVGMEACGGAHHWGRLVQKLGHQARLMPAGYVKPYVKRNKNDGRDAEGVCEAMGRPTMRFVPVKSVESQAMQVLHRTRRLLVRQRTMAANALRSALSEFGIVAAQGLKGLRSLMEELEGEASGIPDMARMALLVLARQWEALNAEIQTGDADRWRRQDRRGGTAADDDTGARSARGDRDPGRGVGCEGVQVGARLCRLAGAHAAPVRQRRQATLGGHLQAGRSHPAHAAHPRRHRALEV